MPRNNYTELSSADRLDLVTQLLENQDITTDRAREILGFEAPRNHAVEILQRIETELGRSPSSNEEIQLRDMQASINRLTAEIMESQYRMGQSIPIGDTMPTPVAPVPLNPTHVNMNEDLIPDSNAIYNVGSPTIRQGYTATYNTVPADGRYGSVNTVETRYYDSSPGSPNYVAPEVSGNSYTAQLDGVTLTGSTSVPEGSLFGINATDYNLWRTTPTTDNRGARLTTDDGLVHWVDPQQDPNNTTVTASLISDILDFKMKVEQQENTIKELTEALDYITGVLHDKGIIGE